MPENIIVTCSQCQHFTPQNYIDDFDNNGGCSKWKEQIASNPTILDIPTNSQFFINELGGHPIHSDIPRNCNKFAGKYQFVKGD